MSRLPVGAGGAPPVFFAPMEGVTSPALRALYARRGGFDVVCTEFVRVTAAPLGARTLARHVVRPPRGLLSVQVMGNHLEQLAEATELVTRAGADIVDLNLGCPAPRVVRKGVGAAMLRDRALLARVVGAMRARTHLPLSAKIRAGFDDSVGVLDVARTLEDAGVDFLTVHPRRRADFYAGVADWRIVTRVAAAVRVPVIGNGDLWYAADAARLLSESGAAGVMLGRPALRNPWLAPQLAALLSGRTPPRPSGADVLTHLEELLLALTSESAGKEPLGPLKEHVRYLARAVPDGGATAREALRTTSVSALLAALAGRLGHLGPGELDLSAEPGALEPRPSARLEEPAARWPVPLAEASAVSGCA